MFLNDGDYTAIRGEFTAGVFRATVFPTSLARVRQQRRGLELIRARADDELFRSRSYMVSRKKKLFHHWKSFFFNLKRRFYSLRTFSAAGPLGPATTSKLTRSPSASDLKPSAWMAE
jgi:hypothetical protein